MPYPIIPSTLKNVESVYLKLMSPEEMLDMSYGEVLTPETINYRTGIPQANGLFCQAIFGPTKDWECQCGKYKRYRYAGVICDKCGVEVAHSSVRRERLGHISLASPCVHPWMLRVIPSRIAILLDMKGSDLSRVCYFSSYVITDINEDMRQEYLHRIDGECENRVKNTKSNFDKKFEDLGKQYQINKSGGKFNVEDLKNQYEAEKEILKVQQSEMINKIETVADMARKELASLQLKDVISENVHQELAQRFGPVFKAEIGAEAIETLLNKIDLPKEFEDVKVKIVSSKTQLKKKLSKKLKLIKHLLTNDTDPTWMILKRIMVLPPELRPMLQLDGGRFAASDLNDLYRKLINRNNRLRKLIQISAPEVILRNEKRMLQEAVEALIDNTTRNGKQVMASSGIKRPLKSLTDSLKGKGGRFRQNLLGKRVDYSGRSVIIIGPNLNIDECGLPKEMALELFKPFLIGRLIAKSEAGTIPESEQCFNIHSARRLIETRQPVIYDTLDEVIKDKYVLLNRAPTLHRLGFLAFKPILIEGKAIQIHPMVCRGFNADFDGDQMAVHVPITIKGQQEARDYMASSKNLLTPANGKLIMEGKEDVDLGVYYLTYVPSTLENSTELHVYASVDEALSAYSSKIVSLNQYIYVRFSNYKKTNKFLKTTVGRIVFNQCLPDDFEFVNETVNKSTYGKLLVKVFYSSGYESLPQVLDNVKNKMFEVLTVSGLSFSSSDLVISHDKYAIITEAQNNITKIQKFYNLGFLSNQGKYKETISQWRKVTEKVAELTKASLDKDGDLGVIISSGARGNLNQVNFMAGMRGLTIASSGEYIELPAVNSYIEGLSPIEYFISMKGHRKGMAGTALQTADAGYLTRRLVDVAQNLVIMKEDCETIKGVAINAKNSAMLNKVIYDRIYGRFLVKDVLDAKNKVLAKSGDYITKELVEVFRENNVLELVVRTVAKCLLPRGVCQKCYGVDLSTHKLVALGVAVGVIGAQSLGEPATQLAVSSVKAGTAIGAKSDITTGLPRVEEVLEARVPKYVAQVAKFDGEVVKISGSLDQGYNIMIKSINNNVSLLSSNIKDSNWLVKDVASGIKVESGQSLAIDDTGESIITPISGTLQISKDGSLVVEQDSNHTEIYTTTAGSYLTVKVGSSVITGSPLTDGSLDLQQICDAQGIDGVMDYIVKEINSVYVSNGIDVDEKHIELVVRQMTLKSVIIDSGGSDLIIGDAVKTATIKKINQELIKDSKDPAQYKVTVCGISRASLATDSFLSAASFQETSRVLVEATLSSCKDNLLGLKENVILGQLIPCGTGFVPEVAAKISEIVNEFDELEVVSIEE